MCLPFASGMSSLFFTLCHMPPALCGPVRFYLLFVSDIWFGLECVWFVFLILYILPHATGLVWSYKVLPSFCPRPSGLVWCVFHMGQGHKGQHNECEKAGVSEVMGGIRVYLMQAVPSLDVLKALCVCPLIRSKMVKCSPLCATVFSYMYSWKKVASPYTPQHCVCVTVVGGSAMVPTCSQFCFSFTFFLSCTDPPSDRQNVW